MMQIADVSIQVLDLLRQSPLPVVGHFTLARCFSTTPTTGYAIRNINLQTIVIRLAGGLYIYKYYPGDGAELQIALPAINRQPKPVASSPEPPRPVPVVTAQPEYQPAPAPVPEPPEQVGSIDPWTTELTRQADTRIVRQRGEWAVQDQQTAQTQVAQANIAAPARVTWRNEKEAAVANLRRGDDAQWVNFWNQRLHAAAGVLYRNHC